MARTHAIPTSDITSDHLGFAITRDVLDPRGSVLVPKGTLIDSATIERLREAGPSEAHLLELEGDELHEDAGGQRVARVAAGPGLHVAEPSQSRCDIVADARGLLRVDAALLRTINHVPDVTIYTMLDCQPVNARTVVASAKITPIAVPERRIAEVERLCREANVPLLQLRPFLPKRVGVLALEGPNAEMRERFEAATERRVNWYGASLVDLRYVEPKPETVADSLRGLLEAGAEVILSAGGNTIDPLDPIELALEPAGARLIHRGAPTRGSMFWIARAGDVPIINLASCRMWIGNTLGDLILPLVMAGQEVTKEDIIEIGYGGLPGSAVSLRFPPYDA